MRLYSDSDDMELEEYLEEEFIPSKIRETRKVDPDTLEEYYKKTIKLSDIYHLNISDEELHFIIDYLDTKGILVIGDTSLLCGEHSNYKQYRKVPFYRKPDAIDKKKQKKLLEEYQKDRSIEIRNQLVEQKMYLVESIAEKISYATQLDIDDLIQYGYEGLIKAIDSYDFSKEGFARYIYAYIRGFIFNGIVSEIQCNSILNEYFLYLKSKKEIEELKDKRLMESMKYIDDILNHLKEKNHFTDYRITHIKWCLLIGIPESLEDYAEDLKYADNTTLYDQTIEKQFKEEFWDFFQQAFDSLKETEKRAVSMIYGLNGNSPMSGREIAKEVGVTSQAISLHHQFAIKKIKRKFARRVGREYVENGIDEYCYDPRKIELPKKKQKKK